MNFEIPFILFYLMFWQLLPYGGIVFIFSFLLCETLRFSHKQSVISSLIFGFLTMVFICMNAMQNLH